MTVEYLDLSDYLAIAAEVTGLDVTTLMQVTRVSLADSALHAPAAGFGDVDLYPEFVDKAAVLLVRLARTIRSPMAQAGRLALVAGVRRSQWVEVAGPTGHRRRRVDRRRCRRWDTG